jgi:hypothetical protein
VTVENAHKEYFLTWRMCGKDPSFFADLIKPFSWRIWRIRGNNLWVHGECAKRLLAYSPNMSRDTKLSIAWLITVQNEFFKIFLDE